MQEGFAGEIHRAWWPTEAGWGMQAESGAGQRVVRGREWCGAESGADPAGLSEGGWDR